ncbi:MAG: hypothetical protein OXI49_00395 [Acidobacteriota bacterium]|nr:hypothetical protein [Acidobacteriota bacterium]
MQGNRLLFLIIGVIVAVAAAVLWFLPRAERLRAPTLSAAWVGVEVGGDGVARTGDIEMAAGQGFRLHAVLATEPRRGDEAGEPVYYSAVPQVEIDGRRFEALPPERIGGLGWVRMLWFSVEHGVPFRELEEAADVERFAYEPFFRPEWGSAWSIDGTLDAHFDGWLENDGPDIDRDFGTLRYQVWVEAAIDEDALVPDQRVKSPAPPDGTRLEARLAGALGTPSAVFGLPGIQREGDGWDPSAVARLQQLHDDRLAFSQVSVLRDILAAGGVTWEDLTWELAPLDGSTAWSAPGGGSPAPGDLVHVGDRWAVLFADSAEGAVGMLDGADLCLDFDAGATVRRLDRIFTVNEEGEGDVFVAAPGRPF